MVQRDDEVRQDSAPTSEADALDQMRAELDEANRKTQEYLSLLQRVQADFANFRRRVEQEREERARSIRADVLLKILPVLDDFERALKALPEDQRDAGWVQGMTLIERKLRDVLDGEGATKIEALGKPFDPWEQEAVMYQEEPGAAPGTVTHVLREGYKLGDRVLRPAQVAVAK